MTLVIGSVPYLNEKPLTRWFQHTEEGQASEIEVRYAPPSVLAQQLAAGEISAALVSSFEYFHRPGYGIIPGVSISGQDEILSVRAFSRLPWRSTESIALDTSSLTSAALLKILLDHEFEAHPDYLHHSPDLEEMLKIAEGALLIGDAGMLAKGKGLQVLDLGQAWRRMTGLPFVYAVWLAPPENITPELTHTLARAKAWGLTQIDIIAQEESIRLGCPVALCRRYLTEIMDYELDDEHHQALDQFGTYARQLGLLSDVPHPLETQETQWPL